MAQTDQELFNDTVDAIRSLNAQLIKCKASNINVYLDYTIKLNAVDTVMQTSNISEIDINKAEKLSNLVITPAI